MLSLVVAMGVSLASCGDDEPAPETLIYKQWAIDVSQLNQTGDGESQGSLLDAVDTYVFDLSEKGSLTIYARAASLVWARVGTMPAIIEFNPDGTSGTITMVMGVDVRSTMPFKDLTKNSVMLQRDGVWLPAKAANLQVLDPAVLGIKK